MGKKQSMITITTLGPGPNPIQTTSSGANASFGMALSATSVGMKACSTVREAASTPPMSSPSPTVMPKPCTVSRKVTQALSSR
jgi:hypothetical protein